MLSRAPYADVFFPVRACHSQLDFSREWSATKPADHPSGGRLVCRQIIYPRRPRGVPRQTGDVDEASAGSECLATRAAPHQSLALVAFQAEVARRRVLGRVRTRRNGRRVRRGRHGASAVES